jgi:putative oxidoreductase
VGFFMSAYTEQTYALMRIAIGFLFTSHGSQKIFGFPGSLPEGIPVAIQYSAGSIELVGGALVMVGLMTRQAAFICSGTMAVAYWIAHGTQALFPIMNQGELAMAYCFAFLFISANGSGIWSVDASRSGS